MSYGPKIVYNLGAGDVTFNFVDAAGRYGFPTNFLCYPQERIHSNLATSGAAEETLIENIDLMIAFDLEALALATNLVATWEAFRIAVLIPRIAFKFYPNPAIHAGVYYNCVNAAGPGQRLKMRTATLYSGSFLFRIVQDSQAPSDPGSVMNAFAGF